MSRNPGSKNYGAALLAVILVAGVTGCETGTTHKTDLPYMQDVTTSPAPTAHAEPADTASEGQPPVPGSPTSSNSDGTQPPEDMQARNSSAHHEAGAKKP